MDEIESGKGQGFRHKRRSHCGLNAKNRLSLQQLSFDRVDAHLFSLVGRFVHRLPPVAHRPRWVMPMDHDDSFSHVRSGSQHEQSTAVAAMALTQSSATRKSPTGATSPNTTEATAAAMRPTL